MIPDWSAQSLRGAYKKFSKFTKKEFISKALIDDETHKHFWYTHTEEFPPIFGPDTNKECPNTTASKSYTEEPILKSEKNEKWS